MLEQQLQELQEKSIRENSKRVFRQKPRMRKEAEYDSSHLHLRFKQGFSLTRLIIMNFFDNKTGLKA